jgi:hypothetical protein
MRALLQYLDRVVHTADHQCLTYSALPPLRCNRPLSGLAYFFSYSVPPSFVRLARRSLPSDDLQRSLWLINSSWSGASSLSTFYTLVAVSRFVPFRDDDGIRSTSTCTLPFAGPPENFASRVDVSVINSLFWRTRSHGENSGTVSKTGRGVALLAPGERRRRDGNAYLTAPSCAVHARSFRGIDQGRTQF